MFTPDIKLIRSSTLGKKFKKIIENKDITISEVAEKMGSSQPQLSSVLNGTRTATDSFFDKLAIAVGLTSKESLDLMKEIDKKEFEYKYGEEINCIPEHDINTLENIDFEEDFIKEMTLSREFRNNDKAIEEARKIWRFLKDKYSNK